MKKEDYLREKIHPYNPNNVKSVEDAFMELLGCSFQGRNLGRALDVLTNMVKDPECFRVLTLSGAMIPAGMEELICQGIERKIINCIVTTGANIIHSLLNSFDQQDFQMHYIGSDHVNDADLYKYRINRIYDIFLPETAYQNAEKSLEKLLSEIYGVEKQYTITPSELFHAMGKKLSGRSFLAVAAKNNVPIFCGATSDSEFGMDLMKYRKRNGPKIILDEIKDVDNFGNIIVQHNKWGTIIIGGGVPRNWAQQIFPFLDLIYQDVKYPGYNYSVRFHSAVPQDGGLSGCTISESVSWGKYTPNATHQSVWGDATVYFPLIFTALFQRMDRIGLKL